MAMFSFPIWILNKKNIANGHDEELTPLYRKKCCNPYIMNSLSSLNPGQPKRHTGVHQSARHKHKWYH